MVVRDRRGVDCKQVSLDASMPPLGAFSRSQSGMGRWNGGSVKKEHSRIYHIKRLNPGGRGKIESLGR